MPILLPVIWLNMSHSTSGRSKSIDSKIKEVAGACSTGSGDSYKEMKWYFRFTVLCVVMLSGCSSSTGIGRTATATPTTLLPTATPTPISINLTPLPAQDAWGNVNITQFSLDMGDRYFEAIPNYNGITDDDQVCGVTVPMNSSYGTDNSQFMASVGLLNLHTGKITLLTTLPAGDQSWDCTVTGSWVIWIQSFGNTLESLAVHWVIKAINRDTGEIRVIDQAKGADGQGQFVSIRPNPYASNGRVVWTTYSSDIPNGTQSEMYTFNTSTKTVLADNTSYPILSWPWVTWGDGKQKAIVCENLETGQQVLLHMQYIPTTTAFHGTTFVYTNSDYSQVLIYPDITDPSLPSYVIEDKSIDGDSFSEFPTINNRLVSWVSDTTSLVFDRKLMRQVIVDSSKIPFAGVVSSHFLISEAPLTQADHDASVKGLPYHHVIRIIDTDTLP